MRLVGDLEPLTRSGSGTQFSPNITGTFFVSFQEKERRKPWVPSTDIRAFDDIFSNALDKTEASQLSNSRRPAAAASLLLSTLLLLLAR